MNLQPDTQRRRAMRHAATSSLLRGTTQAQTQSRRRAAVAEATLLDTPRVTRRGWLSEDGLSLVEVTIMLVVLLILAGTLVPVMSDSVTSARGVRARNDVSQIAVALVSFQRDVGPIVVDGNRLRQIQTAASSVTPIAMLMSGGQVPQAAATLGASSSLLNAPGTSGAASWLDVPSTDLIDLHLRINGHGYTEGDGGPGTGWNGPYLARETEADPWGHAYLVNTAFLRGLPPGATSCSRCAVFVISAGPNGLIETPFQQPIANASVYGDDIAVRIQ